MKTETNFLFKILEFLEEESTPDQQGITSRIQCFIHLLLAETSIRKASAACNEASESHRSDQVLEDVCLKRIKTALHPDNHIFNMNESADCMNQINKVLNKRQKFNIESHKSSALSTSASSGQSYRTESRTDSRTDSRSQSSNSSGHELETSNGEAGKGNKLVTRRGHGKQIQDS